MAIGTATGVGVAIATSNNIYLTVGGKKIAGVQSYSAKYTNDTKTVDAFGQDTPIGYTSGKKKYTLDLTKVFLEDTAIADGLDFYSLNDFNLVINRNGKKIQYTHCIITSLTEDGTLNDKVQEKMSIMALDRKVKK